MRGVDDHEAWAAALAGLDSPDRLDPRFWAPIYRRVSDRIVGGEAEAESTGSRGVETSRELFIRALIFGQRTLRVLERLTCDDWARDRRIFDLGAGTGAVSRWAVRRGAAEVLSLEEAEPELRWLERAAAASGATRWRVSRGSVRDTIREAAPEDRLVFGNSLREIARGDDAEAARLLAPALAAGSELLVVEPGTRPSAHFLAGLRDRLRDHVMRPCRGAARCPRRGERWCHFTWKSELGPLATAVLQSAGRRANLMHFSYLALGPRPSPGPSVRLLEVERRGKRRVKLHLCGPEGESTLDVPPRPRGLRRWAEDLEAGSLIELTPDVVSRGSVVERLATRGPRST